MKLSRRYKQLTLDDELAASYEPTPIGWDEIQKVRAADAAVEEQARTKKRVPKQADPQD